MTNLFQKLVATVAVLALMLPAAQPAFSQNSTSAVTSTPQAGYVLK